MKRLTCFLLLFLFPYVYSQEEFFGNNNGLSLSFLQGSNANIDQVFGTGLSAYFKKGFAVGIAIQYGDYETIPSAAIAFYTEPKTELNHLIASFGLSYAYASFVHCNVWYKSKNWHKTKDK